MPPPSPRPRGTKVSNRLLRATSHGPAEPGPRIIDSEDCPVGAREDAVCPTVQE